MSKQNWIRKNIKLISKGKGGRNNKTLKPVPGNVKKINRLIFI
jgi:hypothetical protein